MLVREPPRGHRCLWERRIHRWTVKGKVPRDSLVVKKYPPLRRPLGREAHELVDPACEFIRDVSEGRFDPRVLVIPVSLTWHGSVPPQSLTHASTVAQKLRTVSRPPKSTPKSPPIWGPGHASHPMPKGSREPAAESTEPALWCRRSKGRSNHAPRKGGRERKRKRKR